MLGQPWNQAFGMKEVVAGQFSQPLSVLEVLEANGACQSARWLRLLLLLCFQFPARWLFLCRFWFGLAVGFVGDRAGR